MKKMILGIGNILKGDDGIGIYVAEKVEAWLKEIGQGSKRAKSLAAGRIITIDSGTSPESYTSTIREYGPDLLILIDAAEMGLDPGSYRMVPPGKIEVMSFSTHNIPLNMFISYVGGFCREVILIGVQPSRTGIVAALSGAVQRSGDRLADLIIEERLNEIQPLEA